MFLTILWGEHLPAVKHSHVETAAENNNPCNNRLKKSEGKMSSHYKQKKIEASRSSKLLTKENIPLKTDWALKTLLCTHCLKCTEVTYTLTVIRLVNTLLLMLHVACKQAEAASSGREKSIPFCQWFTFISLSSYSNLFFDPFVCCSFLSPCNLRGNCLLNFHTCF